MITGLSNRNAHVRGFVSAGIMASPPPPVKASATSGDVIITMDAGPARQSRRKYRICIV